MHSVSITMKDCQFDSRLTISTVRVAQSLVFCVVFWW